MNNKLFYMPNKLVSLGRNKLVIGGAMMKPRHNGIANMMQPLSRELNKVVRPKKFSLKF